jgi:hypothetical protein
MKLSGIIILFVFMTATMSAVVNIPVYSVYELTFNGSDYKATDNPVRDVELVTTWQHEKGRTVRIYGFYDGNGKGGAAGNIFKVRFCPVEQGTWTMISVHSNDKKLNNQNQGFQVTAVKSQNHGFWVVDRESPGSRWYKRSDGSHPYITGNTMYSFLSEYSEGKPTGGNIKDDIINNSGYFSKVRIGITGDRYPNPTSKPFLDANGKQTDDGNYSHRPNPDWFCNRLDLAVMTGFEKDIITDLILNGPDTKESRSVLLSGGNNNDPTPFLKYIAARFGSYPNVWICLSNEFDIKEPAYSAATISQVGKTLQSFLPYDTPLSVHSVRHWTNDLNTPFPWADHVILQTKLKKMDQSADNIQLNYILGGSDKPVIDDELAYEGDGDGWSDEDVIEAFLGVFAGGGYASSGHKTANKVGHYFSGNFKAEDHKAADNLLWFNDIIDKYITFWKMKPVNCTDIDEAESNIFKEKFDTRWRVMAREGREYLIAGSSSGSSMAILPEGTWIVRSFDLITKTEKTLSENASGKFEFRFTNSRAQMFHFLKK